MALSQSSKILVSDINSALAGKQDALGYTPVKTVNNVSPNSAGNVTISVTPSTVKGVLGSAWAVNGTSMTLPSGGTWFVWNTGSYGYGNTYYSTNGVSTAKTVTSNTYTEYGNNFAGGVTVYAAQTMDDEDRRYYNRGKLAAIRIA